MKILILELDAIYRRLEDLHDFWDDFVFFLTIRDYEYLVRTFHRHPDFLKKVSLYLYGLAPTLESILRMEDEEEREEELRRVHKLARGEINRLWDNLGEIMIVGPGAGRRETGQAILADLIAIHKELRHKS